MQSRSFPIHLKTGYLLMGVIVNRWAAAIELNFRGVDRFKFLFFTVECIKKLHVFMVTKSGLVFYV